MPYFTYKASDKTGNILKDVIEAPDEMAAAEMIQSMGHIPIRIRKGQPRAAQFNADVTALISALFNRVSGKDVTLFTQDLATLLQAGLPVDRALSILIDVVEKDAFKKTIRSILKTVQGGGYLSDAIAKYPSVFSRFYCNMVRAGEAGGVLEAVLERLGVFLENTQELKDYIKSALVYPVFLLCVGGLSIIILMTYVIPRFSVIFSDLGGAIPLSTQILLAASQFLKSFWWALIAAAVAGFLALRRYYRTPEGRLTFDRLKLKIPVQKEFVQKREVARFTRTLGTLVKSGVPILQALNLVQDIIGNRIFAESLKQVHTRVKEGEKLSKPLEDTGMFPSLAIQMITVGEETGRLEEMLIRVAESYEKTLKNMVKRLISFMEPAMILVMGVIVAFIVISMLMAIFSMNELPF